jgi:CRISPR/Cas system Type II protein with McrA/HNH and RuvC-like nuclease domain
MKDKVLLINQTLLPLNIIKMKKAIKLFVKGKADILENNGKYFLFEGKKYPYPTVMKMCYFVNISNKKKIVEYSKLNVWKRDKGKCLYCGKDVSINEFTVDHVYPKKLGGTNIWTNVATACFPCNNKKDCKTLEESGMSLIKKPKISNIYETIEQTILYKFRIMKKHKLPYEIWKNYIK